MSESAARPARAKVIAAFAAVYVIWGSTYLAIRFAIETLPPLMMAGMRFALAGSVLYAVLRLRGVPAPTRLHWRSGAVIGALLLLCGNGGVVLAERTVPSGVAALLVAMVPLYMVLVDWLRPGGQRPSGRTALGIAVGFAGMVLLVGPGELAGGGGVDPTGVALVTFGSIAWAVGSIYSQRAPLPKNPFMSTALEMSSAGVLLFAAGLLRGEAAGVDLSAVSTESVLAFFYLVVFGSLVAFSAYVWLLKVSTPSRVSTYAYVNPVVAVLLGWALADEPLTPRVLGAAAVIVAAVAIITSHRRHRPAEDESAGAAGEATGQVENGGQGMTARAAADPVDDAREEPAAPAERPRRRASA